MKPSWKHSNKCMYSLSTKKPKNVKFWNNSREVLVNSWNTCHKSIISLEFQFFGFDIILKFDELMN